MIVPVFERVKVFCSVRDIPYQIALRFGDDDYSCATKTPLLQKRLAALGLPSRRICCRFSWDDFPLPPDIRALALSPSAGHEFLEVLLPERDQWIKLDPTWDRALKSLPLPIAEWDGVSATALAVTPIETFSPEQSADILAQIEGTPIDAWEEFYRANEPFLKALNAWLGQAREATAKPPD